ncbi:hypothetical protein Micbo1qcDRAFT_170041, partial [Microdochium bolleyi]
GYWVLRPRAGAVLPATHKSWKMTLLCVPGSILEEAVLLKIMTLTLFRAFSVPACLSAGVISCWQVQEGGA